ncbi:hypothetical protein J7E73_10450 [Paenibacillus albidus]|uniref:hypothetical protein n=1 Tax=Paenibacillus albidus TaxID=2041023 RepID=UPI001BE8BB0C|nr:hypothetical protein [Paenibacillus albidus]MBT2289546.1 hypothetical protein [Paenibacillus albidus]
MDYTNALQAVADYTGWHMDDVIMTAEYRNGYGFMDREGREWAVTQKYGEFVVEEN